MTTESRPRHLVGMMPPRGKLTIPISPALTDGWVPHVPPGGIVQIVEWDKTCITLQNTIAQAVPYFVGFVRGETVAAMFQAGQAFKSGRDALRKLMGKK